MPGELKWLLLAVIAAMSPRVAAGSLTDSEPLTGSPKSVDATFARNGGGTMPRRHMKRNAYAQAHKGQKRDVAAIATKRDSPTCLRSSMGVLRKLASSLAL
jgi:hypothetical protein